ncbi:5959_t:CDS:1 [Ambispora gerdemannii]|uniref:5959_t:CDS:1 n=1 Tax=Ambispora gerdemannii TaxID=144530 RepID=A0A9N9CQ33_9GLOM|nr:5959_t:CDS:1 [Ambispora gerdemannii]
MENLKNNLSDTFFEAFRNGYSESDVRRKINEILVSSKIDLNPFLEYLNENAMTSEDFTFLGWFSRLRIDSEVFSFRQYEKAFHIDPHNITSQFLLAYCTEFGKGTTKDPVHARELYEKFSSSGNHLCQYQLAFHLMFNVKNAKFVQLKMSYLLKLAAMQGHLDAMLYLGNRYTNGIGLERDLHQSLYWFSKKFKIDKKVVNLRHDLEWFSSQVKKQTH